LANIFVLPFIPLTMFFGFWAVSLSYLNYSLGMIFGFLTYLLLIIMVVVVQFFAALPAAAFDFNLMGWWIAFAYYLLVGWGVWRKG